MFSIGFFELVIVCVVGLLVLKPHQLKSLLHTFKSLFFNIRQTTAEFEQSFQLSEKERDLARRIEMAAKKSDVSDLIKEPTNES